SGPGLMALSPDGKLTLVFSPDNNSITLIDNQTDAVARVPGASSAVPALTLPGPTESMLITNGNVLGFAAVPTAPVNSAPPGALIAFGPYQGGIAATIPIGGARTVVSAHNGNRLLVFSDN